MSAAIITESPTVVSLDAVREQRRGPASRLTRREREVLEQLAAGHTTEQAAAHIYLSPHTVRCHIKTAMRKLGAHTRPHAVAIALSAGAIDPLALDAVAIAS